METYKAKILIVDDEPKSLYTMEMLLSQEPYTIFFAEGGRAALAQVETETPDVILLDVMMPDITGYEVCQRLKADDRWQHVPIILVTALDQREDVIQGLEAGADEFLTKPVNGPELRARVRTMLRMKKQYDELQETLQLRQDMADMIVHDMRSPISALLLYAEILERTDPANISQQQVTQKIVYLANRLNSFLGDLLILAKMRSGKLLLNRTPTDVRQLILTLIEQYQHLADSKSIKLIPILPEEYRQFLLDSRLIQRAIDNLISNALKYSPKGSKVTLSLEYFDDSSEPMKKLSQFRFQISDEGPGIPPEDQERIFNKYEIIDVEREDVPQVGLGLALCKMVVDAHDGRIFVQNNRPTGAIFIIEI